MVLGGIPVFFGVSSYIYGVLIDLCAFLGCPHDFWGPLVFWGSPHGCERHLMVFWGLLVIFWVFLWFFGVSLWFSGSSLFYFLVVFLCTCSLHVSYLSVAFLCGVFYST